MKANLGVHSIEAYKVLRQAMNWYFNPIFSRHVLCVEPDNEVAFVEDVDSDPAVAKRRLANVLQDYVNGNRVILRAPAEKERVKAVCLSAILLGEDSEAKAAFPSVYGEMKGKPLNPIQAEAISTLINEVVKTERKMDEFVMNIGSIVLAQGEPPVGEQMSKLETKREELLKQIATISGIKDKVRLRLFSGFYVMELFYR